jgi:lipopolysaccharide/colanic/teichoic acid biosynthesis glycosyltransferase
MLLVEDPTISRPAIEVRQTPVWKRCLDLVGGLVIGVAALPVLAIAVVYIKIVSPGPSLFTQDRLGRGGKMFRIYKLRTLKIDPNNEQSHRGFIKAMDRSKPAAKPSLDSRLIPYGMLIRKLSIDELPQLWNVLRGDMSLVGPRPDVLQLEDYQDCELRRFEVLPGMTGLWQVSGKNRLSYAEMINLDVHYADNVSPRLDLWILLKTVRAIRQSDDE